MKRFMNIKKLTAILLLLLSLSLLLASCNFSGMGNTSGGENPEEDPDASESPEEGEDPENPEGGDGVVEEKTLTYEEYINLTAEEQKTFIYSFENMDDFFAWHTEAKAKYDEEHKTPEIDGDINIGDLLGPQD